MNLQLLQENLSKALNISSRFTSIRAQLPVLSNVLLVAKTNKMIVSSTNLEVSISLSIGAKVKKQGEITVPAKIMADLVSNIQPGLVNLQTEKEQLKISSQSFSSFVSGMNSSDFPQIPSSVGTGSVGLPKEDFIKSLSQVLFAASIDETRPVLTGILLISDASGLILVATDGFRLSHKKIKLKSKLKKQKIIVPKNALSELSRLSDGDGNIKYSFKSSENQVVFGASSKVLASRIIEGEFPDYQKIIPKDVNHKVFVDREEMLRAIKLASVFARDSANVVTIALQKDSMKIISESSQSGSQENEIDAKVETDSPSVLKGANSFSIAFNYRFLEEFLNAIEGDEVQINLTDASAPGVFIDPKDKDFLHLIMPVRVQD